MKGSIRTTFDTNQSKRGVQPNTSGEEKYLLGFRRGSDECIRQIRINKEEREAISKKEGVGGVRTGVGRKQQCCRLKLKGHIHEFERTR